MDKKIKILILAANPWSTNRLSLDEEHRNIQDLWDKYDPNRERFDVRYYPAVRGLELQEKLLGFKPHLLHFTGHGENKGIVLNDASGDNAHEISKQTLAEVFKLCAPELKAVFLNACYSANQADEIVKQVDYVVGMNAAINDLAAIHFSQGFYTAIFTQKVLDIEAAFKAGLNQMEIAKVSITEQNKPTLLPERYQTFVPGFKHDVFISFATADSEWANSLTAYLREQLRQKLGTADGFQFYLDNDFQQLEQSATLLIITSPAYSLQYQVEFDRLKTHTQQHREVFSVEYEMCNPRPEFLRGFTPHKFWFYDDSAGMTQKITGDNYFVEANKLVSAIADKLKELNSQHQHQENLNQQLQQQKEARDPNMSSDIDALVFLLHSIPDDLDLQAEILPLLQKNGIDCISPLTPSEKTKAEQICQDIENNIRKCDAVLILFKNSSPVWVREQLTNCRVLQRERKKPLKIIALHKESKEELNCSLKNVQIYDCPPEEVKSYFPRFIEALKNE